MITPYVTTPNWKMPDDEKIPHYHHSVCLRMDFLYTQDELMWGGEYHGDLTKYYKWAEKNKIEMEHNLLILGREITDNLIFKESKVYKIHPGIRKAKNTKIMFVFWNLKDANAFEKRWK